jgi:hypothetical protein
MDKRNVFIIEATYLGEIPGPAMPKLNGVIAEDDGQAKKVFLDFVENKFPGTQGGWMILACKKLETPPWFHIADVVSITEQLAPFINPAVATV